MKNTNIKILLTHPGQQHSYRLALALEHKKLLYKYITTVYNKYGSLTRFVIHILKGDARKKAENRHIPNFDDNKVQLIGEVWGLLLLVVQRLSFLPIWVRNLVFELNHIYFEWRAASYAIKHQVDAVIAYDTNASILFSILKKKAPHIKRILDVSAANRLYMKNIYEKDTVLATDFAERMNTERLSLWTPNFLKNRLKEIQMADYFLVPSRFVQKSIEFSRAHSSQMLYCPYGVELETFTCKTYSKNPSIPLHFIYVGGVKEIKGIYYLLEAFKNISPEKGTLTVVGAVNLKDKDLQPYLHTTNFTGTLLHSQLPSLLHKSDVFVFPSLGDSFALSCAEAAACGLPLIVSENTGFKDLMTEGKEGFVIPIQSVDAIVKKVNWFIEHPEQIEPMGRAAHKLAKRHTWEVYYERIGTLIEDLLK